MSEEQIEQVEQEEQQAPEINYEEKAKLQGWVPKEQFRGDPAKHITAKEFVERADNMMPIMRAQNKKYEEQITSLKNELGETKGTLKKIVTLQQKYSDDQYNTQVNNIESQKRKAAEEGDLEAYDRLSQQQKSIKPPERVETKEEEPQADQGQVNFQKWREDNKWFDSDEEMRDWAIGYGQVLANKKHHLAVPGKEYEFGEYVKKKMMEAMPHKFANPNRNTSDLDESSVRGSDNIPKSGQTWNDIPQAARDLYNNRIQHIPGMTKEKYIQDYFEA